jgi:hypothetical protein
VHLSGRQQSQFNSYHIVVHSAVHGAFAALLPLIMTFLQNKLSEHNLDPGLELDLAFVGWAFAVAFNLLLVQVYKFLANFYFLAAREDCLLTKELTSVEELSFVLLLDRGFIANTNDILYDEVFSLLGNFFKLVALLDQTSFQIKRPITQPRTQM